MKSATYIRVGTTYYKLVQIPTIAGQLNEIIVPWKLLTAVGNCLPFAGYFAWHVATDC